MAAVNKSETSGSQISVLMTSTSYPLGAEDWKGVFIRQLLTALSEDPRVQMNYWGPPGDLPVNTGYSCFPDESVWLKWMMDQGGIIHMLRQKGIKKYFSVIRLLLLLRRAYCRSNGISVFHVNWLQNALPLWGIERPALITVLGSDFGLLKLPGMTTLLRHIFKRRRCLLAPNAEWMVNELQKRFGDVAQIISIPLGIDRKWFETIRRRQDDVCRWLVVSRLTSKKIGPIFNWGRQIFADSSIHELHVLGPMQEKMVMPDWVHYHGATHPEALANHWFPKATGLITLSQHDEGRPQILLEAMAAGLPIIASNLDAHKDLIDHGKTGLLVESQEDFSAGIEWLTDENNNQQIAWEARKWVKREIGTWTDCARRFTNAYCLLLNGVK